MIGFAEGDGDVLLATNIIESGLDVPNANTMLVLAAGPLRARTASPASRTGGPRPCAAYCYLMTDPGTGLPESATRGGWRR